MNRALIAMLAGVSCCLAQPGASVDGLIVKLLSDTGEPAGAMVTVADELWPP